MHQVHKNEIVKFHYLVINSWREIHNKDHSDELLVLIPSKNI